MNAHGLHSVSDALEQLERGKIDTHLQVEILSTTVTVPSVNTKNTTSVYNVATLGQCTLSL